MTPRVQTAHAVWGIAALAIGVLGAGLGITREPDPPLSAPPAPARAPRSTPATDDLDLTALTRPATLEIAEHLFAPPPSAAQRSAPSPPPAAPVVTAQPPPPKAPSLPFRYLGRLVDGERISAFVASGTQNLSLKTGDVIDNLYRVERIADDALDFVYLPLDERQSLTLGARP